MDQGGVEGVHVGQLMRSLFMLVLLCAAPVFAEGGPPPDETDFGLLWTSSRAASVPPASPEWTARGCARDSGVALTSLVIPNVTVAANEVLVVFYGERVSVANQQQGFTTATWGATPLNAPDNAGGTFAGSSIWGGQLYLRPGSGGTQNVTISVLVTDGAVGLVGCAETVSIDTSFTGKFSSSGAAGPPEMDNIDFNPDCDDGIIPFAYVTQEAMSAAPGSTACSSDPNYPAAIPIAQRTGLTTATSITLTTYHPQYVGVQCGDVTITDSQTRTFWVILVGLTQP